MSQENSNQKRRWLKRILNVHTPRAWWLAPALLTPMMASVIDQTAFAQTPPAARNSISDTAPTVDSEFVLGWLQHAEQQAAAGNQEAAAKAFAEALRGRKQLTGADQRVESRLKEVNQKLVDKGYTLEQVQAAFNSLGAIQAVPGQRRSITSPLDRRDQLPHSPSKPQRHCKPAIAKKPPRLSLKRIKLAYLTSGCCLVRLPSLKSNPN
ncbi:MAG: hypothetical protein R3C53_03270 [Pirellulaceae bacterium]